MAKRKVGTTSNRAGTGEVIPGSRKKNPNQRTREFGGWSSNPVYGDPSEKKPSRRRGNFDDPQPHGKKWTPADFTAQENADFARAEERAERLLHLNPLGRAGRGAKKGASALGSIGKAVLSKLFGRSEDGIDKAIDRFETGDTKPSDVNVDKLIKDLRGGEDESSASSSKGGGEAPPSAPSKVKRPFVGAKAPSEHDDLMDAEAHASDIEADFYRTSVGEDDILDMDSPPSHTIRKPLFDRDKNVEDVTLRSGKSSGDATPPVKPEGPFGREGSPTGKLAPGAGVRKAGTSPPMANLAARGNDTSFNTESRTPTLTPEPIRTESARPSSTLRQEKRPLTKVEAARERMFSEEQDSGTSRDTASEWSNEQIGEI